MKGGEREREEKNRIRPILSIQWILQWIGIANNKDKNDERRDMSQVEIKLK